MKFKMCDQDFVFLSYDEPNADDNYKDLLTKVPTAKRVHGVTGFDSAHKACADVAETENFITVDGDTVIDTAFLTVEIDTDELGATADHVFSWSGKIDINGLIYGNGSLKLWPKSFVKEMRTHENADPDNTRALIDFCYDAKYFQFNNNYSTSVISATPYQAWRAAFREGVKMHLKRGERTTNTAIWYRDNFVRLLIWGSVGRDYNNGVWSMLGARDASLLMRTGWDFTLSRDYEFLNEYWEKNFARMSLFDVDNALNYLKTRIEQTGLKFCDLSSEQSEFFKQTYTHPTRVWKEYKY